MDDREQRRAVPGAIAEREREQPIQLEAVLGVLPAHDPRLTALELAIPGVQVREPSRREARERRDEDLRRFVEALSDEHDRVAGRQEVRVARDALQLRDVGESRTVSADAKELFPHVPGAVEEDRPRIGRPRDLLDVPVVLGGEDPEHPSRGRNHGEIVVRRPVLLSLAGDERDPAAIRGEPWVGIGARLNDEGRRFAASGIYEIDVAGEFVGETGAGGFRDDETLPVGRPVVREDGVLPLGDPARLSRGAIEDPEVLVAAPASDDARVIPFPPPEGEIRRFGVPGDECDRLPVGRPPELADRARMLREGSGLSTLGVDQPDLSASAAVRKEREPAVGRPLRRVVALAAVRERKGARPVGGDEPDVALVAAVLEVRLRDDEGDPRPVRREARLRERRHGRDVLDGHRAGGRRGERREKGEKGGEDRSHRELRRHDTERARGGAGEAGAPRPYRLATAA